MRETAVHTTGAAMVCRARRVSALKLEADPEADLTDALFRLLEIT